MFVVLPKTTARPDHTAAIATIRRKAASGVTRVAKREPYGPTTAGRERQTGSASRLASRCPAPLARALCG
jgi:hypothetical protein